MRKENKMVTIITHCPFCRKSHKILVNEIDYLDYEIGLMKAQEAFFYLTSAEREMIISGICPTCWEQMIGEEEE